MPGKNCRRIIEEIKDLDLKKEFQKDPHRAKEFTLQWQDFYVDYSKNLINKETRATFDRPC